MYLGRTLAIVGVIYFGSHIVHGYLECESSFCPGDREADWIYEYTDEDTGRRMIVVDGKPVYKDVWEKNLGIDKIKARE
jgi:hypothetical protein